MTQEQEPKLFPMEAFRAWLEKNKDRNFSIMPNKDRDGISHSCILAKFLQEECHPEACCGWTTYSLPNKDWVQRPFPTAIVQLTRMFDSSYRHTTFTGQTALDFLSRFEQEHPQ